MSDTKPWTITSSPAMQAVEAQAELEHLASTADADRALIGDDDGPHWKAVERAEQVLSRHDATALCTVQDLDAQCDARGREISRLRAELTRRRTEDLTLRGILAPADGRRPVPMALGDSVAPAVEWLLAEVDRLRAEHAPYEMLTAQQCPAKVHPDWLIDSEDALSCPWCLITEQRDALRQHREQVLAEAAEELERIADAVEAKVAEYYGQASGIGPGSAEMVREAARTVRSLAARTLP